MTQTTAATRTFAFALAAFVSTATWMSTVSLPAGDPQMEALVAAAAPATTARTA